MFKVNNDDPSHHLSSKWATENINMAFSAKTHIENTVVELETMSERQFTEASSPVNETHHPEIDDLPFLSAKEHSQCRSMIGCANWSVMPGRFDVACAVNTCSRFS